MTVPIGTRVTGGFFAGDLNDTEGLIVAPKAPGELTEQTWNGDISDGPEVWAWRTKVAGACSWTDGRGNTEAMAAAGSVLAQKFLNLVIEGITGYYLPSLDELGALFKNFQPCTYPNSPLSRFGSNTQTTVAAYQAGGAEAFAACQALPITNDGQVTGYYPVGFVEPPSSFWSTTGYWSSTQSDTVTFQAWALEFTFGMQQLITKTGVPPQDGWANFRAGGPLLARAVTRVLLADL